MIETIYSDPNFLAHYGVKGMKWGIRKAERRIVRNVIGSATGHYDRNKNNTNLPHSEEEARKQGYIKLSNKMSGMHQFKQEDGVKNSKWISKDGHKEVVFSGKEKHITPFAEDEGSYNFYNPTTNPLGHAFADVLPYIILGNSKGDSTTIERRIQTSLENVTGINANTINEQLCNTGYAFTIKHKIT